MKTSNEVTTKTAPILSKEVQEAAYQLFIAAGLDGAINHLQEGLLERYNLTIDQEDFSVKSSKVAETLDMHNRLVNLLVKLHKEMTGSRLH